MNIEVKGVNDVLMMKMNQNCCFDTLLEDLNTLLDQPLFHQEGYYPKAFFDFGCRKMKEDEMRELIRLLQNKKRVLFDGIAFQEEKQHLNMVYDQLHNGEEIIVTHQTLFLGIINPGSYVYCYENVYFLNIVRGTIIAMNENVKIYGHHFEKAQIMINQKTLHDLTTSALTSVYYKDDRIYTKKEDGYEQNDCHNFR